MNGAAIFCNVYLELIKAFDLYMSGCGFDKPGFSISIFKNQDS